MKKFITTLRFSFFSLLITTLNLYAQTADASDNFLTPDMLSDPVSTEKAKAWQAVPNAALPAKVSRSFSNYFKDAHEANWYNLKNFYLAEFILGERHTRALFAKNGFMEYTIKRGEEKNLPKVIRHNLKSNYVDYAITTVNEVRVNGQTVWIVNLQDPDNLVLVRVADGDFEEIGRYVTRLATNRKGRVVFHK